MIDIDETEKQVKLLQSKSFIRMQLDLPEVLELIERVRQAEARIAEAAKLHRKVEVAWRDGSHVEFVCNYCSDYEDDPWPCKTAVALGLNEGDKR